MGGIEQLTRYGYIAGRSQKAYLFDANGKHKASKHLIRKQAEVVTSQEENESLEVVEEE